MTPLLKIVLALVASTFIYFSQSAVAHQQKTAITTLLFNQRSGHLEISHRFYIHDAEHAVKRLLDRKADLINNSQTQADFGNYVQTHFGLRTSADKVLALSYVGHEVEGKFFWVYQEVEIPGDIKGLEIFHDSLQKLWPSQINLVNIEGKGAIQSLRLTTTDGWQAVFFD